MRIDFDLDDLTNSALKRLVKQLLTADGKEEKAIMDRLAKHSKKAPKNDLADLHEEMHGSPKTPKVEEDSAFDLEVHGDDPDDSDTDMKGRK